MKINTTKSPNTQIPDANPQICKVRLSYKCFKYLLTKLSNNIDVFVIFRWSFTLAIFETIAETTQEILENWTFCCQLYVWWLCRCQVRDCLFVRWGHPLRSQLATISGGRPPIHRPGYAVGSLQIQITNPFNYNNHFNKKAVKLMSAELLSP